MATLFQIDTYKTKEEAEERIKFIHKNRKERFLSVVKEPTKPTYHEENDEWLVIYSTKL